MLTEHTLLATIHSKFSVKDATLVVLDGPHKGESLALDRELLRVGRAPWCDLVLSNDRKVSSEHCELRIDAEGFRLRDLGSRNGIRLDACRVLDAYVDPGTSFQLGHSTLQIQTLEGREREIDVLHQDKTGTLYGAHEEMRHIFSRMERLAQHDVSALLTGETGTGKTSIARAIHHQSPRASGPFVAVNCGALPSNLIEAELFGYEKGAFTGATSGHKGYFEQAHGGTLFLDEIGEMPLELQPKLLQVLEDKKIRRLGAERSVDVDLRLLCATHRNIRHEIKEGRFREDLYFRLAVVELQVPSLRHRSSDIPVLASMFLKQLHPQKELFLTPSAMAEIQSYSWPGNIRQLRNVLERAVIFLEGDVIEASDLYLPEPETEPPPRPALSHGGSPSSPAPPSGQGLAAYVPAFPDLGDHSFRDINDAFERALLDHALQQTGRNVKEAAGLLNISQGWFYKRIKKYELKTRLKP